MRLSAGGIEARQLPGGAGIGVIGAGSALEVFRSGAGGGAGFFFLTLRFEGPGKKKVGASGPVGKNSGRGVGLEKLQGLIHIRGGIVGTTGLQFYEPPSLIVEGQYINSGLAGSNGCLQGVNRRVDKLQSLGSVPALQFQHGMVCDQLSKHIVAGWKSFTQAGLDFRQRGLGSRDIVLIAIDSGAQQQRLIDHHLIPRFLGSRVRTLRVSGGLVEPGKVLKNGSVVVEQHR